MLDQNQNPFGDIPVEEELPEAPTERMASEKQEGFISRLISERDLTGLPSEIELLAKEEVHTFREAQRLIPALMDAPKAAVEDREPPEGIHFTNDTVYKVQVAVHSSGKRYAKQLVVGRDEGSDRWDYIGRNQTFWTLSEKTLMTVEQAREFGRLYGMCCVCGATLTDETSIARGIGPVCEGKMRKVGGA